MFNLFFNKEKNEYLILNENFKIVNEQFHIVEVSKTSDLEIYINNYLPMIILISTGQGYWPSSEQETNVSSSTKNILNSEEQIDDSSTKNISKSEENIDDSSFLTSLESNDSSSVISSDKTINKSYTNVIKKKTKKNTKNNTKNNYQHRLKNVIEKCIQDIYNKNISNEDKDKLSNFLKNQSNNAIDFIEKIITDFSSDLRELNNGKGYKYLNNNENFREELKNRKWIFLKAPKLIEFFQEILHNEGYPEINFFIKNGDENTKFDKLFIVHKDFDTKLIK